MKQTKKFLTRLLTILLVVMTLFSTMSVGFTASAATVDGPEEYTETYDLGATPDEAPKGETVVETPEKKPEESEDSKDADVVADAEVADDADSEEELVAGEEIEIPVRTDKEDIADVGADVDHAGTGANQAPSTVKYAGDLNSWGQTSGSTWTFTNVAAGTYEFKVVDSNGNWYGNNGTMNSGDSGWDFWDDCRNCKFNVPSKAAKVVFKWSNARMSYTVYYNVTWLNGNGSTLETDEVKHGGSATCSKTPTKASTAQYSYTHSGWDKSASSVKSNLTITPTFTSTVRSYTVTWKNGDGSTLDTKTVNYGSSASTSKTPTKASTAKYSYTFSGWDKSTTNITGNTTVNPEFTSTVRSYTLTIKAGTNGKSVSPTSKSIKYDSTYDLDNVTVTANTGYKFSSWSLSGSGTLGSGNVVTVQGNCTATANFTKQSYTVKFVDWDGTQISSQSVKYQEAATAPSNPTRTGYTFAGWDKSYSSITAATTITATYTINSYKISVAVDSSSTGSGTVSGGGTGNYNTTKQISATASTGSTFTKWSDGNTSNPRTVTIGASNKTYYAIFTINTYTISAGVNNTSGGSASKSASSVTHGNTVKLTPTANNGYYFSGWDISGNYSTTAGGLNDSYITIQPTSNITATAYFYAYNVRLPGSFNGWDQTAKMTLGSSNVYTKTVELAPGTYEFKIIKNAYDNDQWYGKGTTITDSTSGTTFEMGGGNCTLKATGGYYTFKYTATSDKLVITYEPYNYTVTAKVGLSGAGTAKASSTSVDISKTTTLTATVNSGYTFNGWTLSGNYTITSGTTSDKSLTIAVFGDVTATAKYTAHKGTVNFSAQTGGSVTNSGDNSVTYPTAASSKATTTTGYTFTGWTITGGTQGTDWDFTSGSASSNSISIKVYKNNATIKAVAKFRAHTSTLTYSAGSGGSVSNSGSHSLTYPGTKASTATPNYGYNFSKWTITGGTAGTDYKITAGGTDQTSITIQPITDGAEIVATASFTKKSYTVTTTKTTGGSVSASKSVTFGGTYEITATPSYGYYFSKWEITSNDSNHPSTLSSTSTATTTVTVNCNVTVKAHFEKITYTVSLAKTPSAGGTVKANSTSVKYLNSTTITATPAEGYSFVKWEITSGTGTLGDSKSASTTLTVESDVTVKATFKIAVYTVNFRDHADFGSEIVNTQQIEHGSNASTPGNNLLDPEDGWEFYSWGDASAYQNVKKNLDIYAVRSNQNVQLLGDVVGTWSTGTARRMTYHSNGTNTKTIKLPKGTYEFKLYTEEWGKWRGNGGTIVDTTNTTASAGWDSYEGANNFILQASGGNYTFTYYRSTGKLKITFEPIQYKVSTAISPTAGGTISISNTNVNLGDTTTLKVTKTNPGYTFSKWTFSGTYTITDGDATSKNVTINPSTAVTATAVFTANSGTVEYATMTGGSVTNRGENAVTYPNEVKSTATANDGYTFTGWTISGGTEGTDYTISTGSTSAATIGIKVYTSGKTIVATANFSANSSTVKFVAGNGGTVTNAGNNSVTYPGKKESTATPSTGYNFSGWTITGGTAGTDYKITAGGTDQTSITIQPITGKTITATANFTIKTYTVTFKNWDGSVLKTQTVDHGSAATAPSNPTRESTAQYSFTFKAWDTDFSNVTKDLTVTATYTQNIRSYTVKFVDYNGAELKTQTVEYGKGATAPSDPSRSDGWIFDGWDKSFSTITGDLTVTAKYWDNNVYLVGVTGSWDQTDKTKMSYATTSSKTLTLDEGTYEFKFVYKGNWQGNNGTVTNTTDVNGSSNPWETYNGNNITLNAIGGTYKFTFNKDTWRFEVKHTPIVYTVKFYNEGDLLKTQSVNRGDNATPPANPTKVADAQYTYTFKEWDKSYTGVRSNLEINAVYTKTLNKYSVIFKDYDGTVLATQNVEYGKGATAPASPTRAGYTFTGWDKDFSNITGALTVTAQYSINTYTVKFVNWNGAELKTQNVEYGKAATAPANPTREADAQYTYTFKGWDKAFNKITEDTTVTATYTQTLNNYTVKFVNWDGSVYKTQTVAYGSAATAPSNPTRNDGWTFIGWDTDAYKNVTGDLTVTAQWTDNNVYLQGGLTTWTEKGTGTKMSYGNVSVMSLELAAGTYEFKLIYGSGYNDQGELKNTWYGNNGEIQDTTLATSSIGWEMTTSAGNCKLIATGGTYTFKFNKTTKYLTVEYFSNALDVTFKDYDGTILATAKVEEGKTAASVAPADPTRNATAEYTYTFAGWSPSINTAITADTVFTATYTQTKNQYTVTFKNWDGTTLGTSTVDYGTAATYTGATPTRDADAQYTYTFNGWDKDITNVTSNFTATAKYSTTVNKYDVTFKYYTADGKTEKTTVVSTEYGAEAQAPTVPTRTDNHTFIGWDKDFSFITGTLTVTAKYRNDNAYLAGSFNGWELSAMKISGDNATASVTLVPGTYTFKLVQHDVWYGNNGTIEDTTTTTSGTGWDMHADAGNCTLVASGGTYTFTWNTVTKKVVITYEPTTYTVKFVDWDNTQIGATQTIAIGKSATAPADPVRESTVSHDYTFSGWSEDFSSVTKDMVIVAQYKETLRKYTVVFSYIDADGTTTKTESQQVEYGTAATAPTLPVREDGQALKNWDKDFSNITGDLTVTALYFDDNTYIKGSFNNWDDTGVLKTYGNKTVSKRIELTEGTYEFKFFHNGTYYTDGFAGTVEDTTGNNWWTTTNDGGVGNTKLVAKGGWYTFTWNTDTKAFKIAYEPYMYTVTFMDYDNKTVLSTQQVAIGTAANAPATPTRTDGWVFDYWDTDFSNVRNDMTVTAVYYDNNVYLMGINGDWTSTTAANRLTNKGTDNVVELTREIGKTEGDTFVQSQHEFKFKQHDTWYTYSNRNSKVIIDSTQNSWYSTNTNATDNANSILKASGGKYTFKFALDTKDFNIHYEALTYDVIFYDYALNVLKTEKVAIGKSATAPDVPTRSNGFKFLKWDKDFSCVTSRLEVKAQYYDDKMYLSGDFNNWGTTALSTYGDKIQTATFVLEPGSYGFNFFHNEPVEGVAVRHYHTDLYNGTFENETTGGTDGWWDTKKADGGQTTINSTGGIHTFYYNTETNQFKVTYTPNVFDVTFVYYDVDGKTLIEDVQDVKLGEAAVLPEIPERKDGWVFAGWDSDADENNGYQDEYTNVTRDITVYARYIDENVYFTAQFNNWNEKATPMSISDDGNIVYYTHEYTAGTYDFKIHKGDGWYSYDGTIIDETTSAVQMSTSVQNNAKLQATGGYYTFTFNKVNNTLTVSYEPYVYTVTFVDYDDTVLKTEEVEITKSATAPEDPKRNDGFVFTGWNMNFDNILADLTVKAEYKDDNVYLMGIDGDWTNGKIMSFSEDSNLATYTIRNVSTPTEYEFKFLYEGVWYTDINAGTVENSTDGNWWSTTDDQSVGNTKLSTAGGSYTITFNKTDKTFKVEAKPNIYHVTFNYYGKTYLEPITTTVAVEAGGDVELPVLETRTDEWFYLFWAENVNGEPYGTRYTQTITNVTQDMTIQAWYFDDNAYLIGEPVDGVWNRTLENIMEDYNFEAGTSTKVIHLDYGQYEFKVIHRHDGSMNDYMYGNTGTINDTCYNWDMSTSAGNCTINASGGTYTFTFNRNTKQLSVSYVPDVYTVTFKEWDGTILDTQEVNSAQAAVAPEHADRTGEGYVFNGWDKDFSCILEDTTVTATYYDDKVYIVGDFNDWVTDQIMGPYGSNPVSAGFYLEPGTYKFKLLHNGNWYGNNGTIYDSAEGWTMSTSEGDCTLNASGGYYTFQFDPVTKKLTVLYDATTFTVKFFDWDGTLLDTQTVARGNDAVPPTGLTKEGDVQYSYEHTGWDKEYTNIQSDMDITAVYTATVNKYDVTFVDHNNEVIAVVPTEYGTAAVAPEVPARADGWVFSHWDKDFSNITGELTVQAQYINGNVFLVGTFNSWNETANMMQPTGNPNEFSTTILLHHGLSNEFKIKVGDGWFGNPGTFTDTTDVDGKSNPWSMNNTDINQNNTTINSTGGYYTFIYNTSTNKLEVKYQPFIFTVNFYDYNDVLLHTEQVEITKSATAPEAPTRDGGYLFKGWSTDAYTRVLDDLDVYATYYDDNLYLKGSFNEWGTENMLTKYGDDIVSVTIELEPGTYPFKFYKEGPNNTKIYYTTDGATIIDSTDWRPSYADESLGDTYLIANGGYYTFTFNHENQQFKIDYRPYKYLVTFVYIATDGMTEVRDEQWVDRHADAEPPTDAYKQRNDGMLFLEWDKSYTDITEDTVVTAKYYDDNLYLVGTFNNWKHTNALGAYGDPVLSTRIELAPGEYEFKFYRNETYYTDINAGTVYDATGGYWSTSESGGNTKLNATGGYYTFTFDDNTDTFKVEYEPYVYTVTFKDHDGTVLKTEEVDISKDATAPADPTREHYDFTGWDKEFTNIQGNLTVTATYKIHSFEVTFVYYTADCKETSVTQTVDYGSAAEAPTLPIRSDGWVFSYWDKDFSFITEDITTEAQYINDNVYLAGTFNGWNETTLPMNLTNDPNVVKIEITLDDLNPDDKEPYTYEFKLKRGDGWFTNDDIVVVDATNGSIHMDSTGGNTVLKVTGGDYTFTYNKVTQQLTITYSPYKYEVTFKNWDGTVIGETQIVLVGNDAKAPANNPTRPADPDGTKYEFTGWDKDFTNVQSDLVVTAQYKVAEGPYTVTFVDWNGTVLKSQVVNKGGFATAPADPSRDADAQYTYTFTGWDKDFTNVTTDITVTATYTQTTNKYKVTFKDYNGKVIQVNGQDYQMVEYGSAATAPADPTRLNYAFTGWDKDFSSITGELTVTAQYVDDRVYLNGTFNGWDNSIVMTKTGENTYSVTLELEGDYQFKVLYREVWFGNNGTIEDTTVTTSVNGWDMSTSDGNCTLEASGGKYQFIYNTATQKLQVIHKQEIYTVVFQYDNGEEMVVISTQEVEHGKAAVAPTPGVDFVIPEGMEFAGWDEDFSVITDNLTVTAMFSDELVYYNVVFVNWDETILGQDRVLAGQPAKAPTTTPTREADAQYTYEFAGWDKDFSCVSDDMTVTATYTATLREYTVMFLDYYGALLGEIQYVKYGQSATEPTIPEIPGYTFTGWDKDFTNVQSDLTVNALYEASTTKFKVYFYDESGTVIQVNGQDYQEVTVGGSAIAPEAPEKAQDVQYIYTFKEWDKDFTNVTSDLHIYPVYTSELQKYTVTFIDSDDFNNAVLKTQTDVEYGTAATAPTITTKISGGYIYIFTGWDADYTNVQGDITVKATYRSEVRTFTVTFKYEDSGDVIAQINNILYGNVAYPPTVPLEEGFSLDCWLDEDGNEVNLSKTNIYRNRTFYARVVDSRVFIEGTVTNSVKTEMKPNGNANEYRWEIFDLAERDGYTFRFIYLGKDYTYNGTIEDATDWHATGGTNYTKLNATGGHYIFEFDTETKEFRVVYSAPKYIVTFYDEDRTTVLSTQVVERGKPADAPANPTKANTAQYSYTFKEWSEDFSRITSNLDVYAIYNETVNKYTVTFLDWDGSTLEKQTVEYGQSAANPADPTRTRPNYTFVGWEGDWTNVTQNLTIIAQYQGNTYRVDTFDSTGGTASASASEVVFPETVELTAEVTEDGYRFRRWNIEGYFEIVEGSLTDARLVIKPNSNIEATPVFGRGVGLTVHSYSDNGYEHLYISESNGSQINYPAGQYPGTKQPDETDFNGVIWKTSEELAMTNGYSTKVIAQLTNGLNSIPAGSGNLVMFENTLGWDTVYLYTNSSSMWNSVDGEGVSTVGATRYTMTNISGTNYWYAYVTDTAATLFIKDIQDAYNNIYNTQACYRMDYNSSKPVFTPSTTSNQTLNGTNYYSDGTLNAKPVLQKATSEIQIQNVLYNNGVWAGVDEVWINDEGIVTLRRELLDMIESMSGTYNNGVNAENYTEDTWTEFVAAYENALEYSGASDGVYQGDIDFAEEYLQEAYDALMKQTYQLIVVTQTGGVGTVKVNDTIITESTGSANVAVGSSATVSVSAPENCYITGIIANGDILFTNSNQTITGKTVDLREINEEVQLEVIYERKLSYAITVHPYDATAGTLYYGDRELSPEGDAITVFAGDSATIVAVPNEGYVVDKWIIDQTGEFFKDTYTFTSVKENHEISINWKEIVEVTVTIKADPYSAGVATAVSGNKSAASNGTTVITINQYDTVALTATVTDLCFEFNGWDINGEHYAADTTTSINALYNIVATGDIVVTATYKEVNRKIYLINEAEWTQPYLYYWGSTHSTDTWPGTKMTYDSTSGYWVGYIPKDTTDIQFNDGTNKNEVNFDDVTPNIYSNGTGEQPGNNYVEPGYYLQGEWNGTHHSAFDLEKFRENADGTYSITITVTKTEDGYIYVNPTNELSHFWNAETDGLEDNPQTLTDIGQYTDNPNQVKVEIDPDDFNAEYEVTFTFDPDGVSDTDGNFWWTVTPLIPTISVIGTDGRGTNSADESMITTNDRVGDTYFDVETVVRVENLRTSNGVIAGETAAVIAGDPVTFYTQVNGNAFGTYDYYVYGWVINGTEFVYATNMGGGLYSGSYIFTEENSTVVPVYFHTNEWLTANNVKHVTVYAVADKSIENWNQYFSAYTWYNNSNSETVYSQFGEYPGQLMIPIAGLDGVYFTFIETTSPDGVNVSGVTFSNYAPNVSDTSNMDTIVVDYTNIQTYDYLDFVALLEDNAQNITFVIKNTNDKYNSDRLSGTTSVKLSDYQFVQYTDYSGLKTDIFGNNIEAIDATLSNSNALYIIQAGDKSLHDGETGGHYVQCFIYDATGKHLYTCFSHELHDKDSAVWAKLANYKNQRVYFSYEAMNDNRYDGEWYGDANVDVEVNVSVNVAVTTDGGKTFTTNTTDPVNEAVYGAGYINATEQNIDILRGSNFTLTAVSGRGYRFVGWYSQNGQIFSTNISYVATSAVGATYTAVFEELDKNNFYVNHYIYTGVGTTSSIIPEAHGGHAQLYVGIENTTLGETAPLALAETASVVARVGDELIITIATDAIGADKFFAWYVEAKDKFGLTSFEEVGVDSVDNIYNNNGTVIGRRDMVYFQFKYTVKADSNGEMINSMTLYSDLVPISVDVILEYQYEDHSGNIKSYYVPYTLTIDEILGFKGNDYREYTPAYISGDGWINTILANAPYIEDYRKDTTWVINNAMYDTMTFVLWATQTETTFTVTTQIGDTVIINQVEYNDVLTLDIRLIIPDLESIDGFWYDDVNNNGSYDAGIDLILTYGPRYGYRVTRDMNVNYNFTTEEMDFEITIDEGIYGRYQTSNADGSNKVDKVTIDYLVNILVPYSFDGEEFIPEAEYGEEMYMHATLRALEAAGFDVSYGVILEQVGSFAPGSDKYPTFDDALKAAEAKNYGKATDSSILTKEVLNGYTKPVMTSTGTYCTVYSAEHIKLTNKNRYQFAFEFNNTAANQKKFFNVYSYVTVTTPDGETTTYISNVQTLNIYNTGIASVVE